MSSAEPSVRTVGHDLRDAPGRIPAELFEEFFSHHRLIASHSKAIHQADVGAKYFVD